MPLTLAHPGVYIQELEPAIRTVRGVPTSITAFVGRARRGLVDEPVRVQGFGEFERLFGGLWDESPMSYAVQHFFLNGGADALIVRVHHESAPGVRDHAATDLAAEGGGVLRLEASSPGTWGNRLQAVVTHPLPDPNNPNAASQFHLTIQETDGATPPAVVTEEKFLRLTLDPAGERFVTDVLEQESELVRGVGALPGGRPVVTADPEPLIDGNDGLRIDDADVAGPDFENARRGIFALEDADLFNLLCIPPYSDTDDVDPATWDAAVSYCTRRRAVVIVDPPVAWNDPQDVLDNITNVVTRRPNAALYFPRICAADPLREKRLREFAPSGVVAGVIARLDAARGVWKASAGLEAAMVGARELTLRLTDGQNGQLNPRGVNCLRTFPAAGRVVWGARTLVGDDDLASQWAYLPVRRTALFIEESLFRGSQWVVFEPNDEKLWSQIRLTLGAFMHGLFRQGAFQGVTPQEAYFVKCDSETTTQADIDRGIVNIVVGFAPLKPAEFVVIQIQQIAGQVEV
ncbi:phage tail sheath family protein [Geodermatophilus sp. SYSU D01180]